jgi:diamine N-acetyltransferase
MDLHLARTFGPELQALEITDPANICLVAIADAQLIGYALLRGGSAHQLVTGHAPCEVRRFYVDAAWHGRGAAPALMAAARDAARRAGAGALWLTAWERNPRALGFYAKAGFRDVGTSTFVLGASRQTDRVLVLDLGAD